MYFYRFNRLRVQVSCTRENFERDGKKLWKRLVLASKMKLRRPNLDLELLGRKSWIVSKMYLLPGGRKLIPIEEFITSRCPCKWQRNSSNPFIPTLLSLILTSLSLPSRSFTFSTPIEQFALPETSARSYEEKLPFLPSHSSLPTNLSFSLSLYTSGRCASFLPTVGKLALTRTTKECNQ